MSAVTAPAGARLMLLGGGEYEWGWWNVLEGRWVVGYLMSAAELACLPQAERDAIKVHGHEILAANGHVLYDLAKIGVAS